MITTGKDQRNHKGSNLYRLFLVTFKMLKRITLLAVLCVAVRVEGRLTVSGRDLLFNGQKVFLSGTNIAWNSYGYDFGNGQYHANSKSTLEGWLTQIANSGGNSVRIWLHVEGDNTPAYDGNGFVTGPDRDNTMISDLREFLDFAQTKNILVILALWNGAYLRNQNTINLMWDDSKLQTYIDRALKPMVTALAGHPALGAWEIMNEPEGSVRNNEGNSNPCFDTNVLSNSGAGWTGLSIPMQRILRFTNWQAHAIKEADSGALVTLGSWSEKPQTDAYSDTRNYYKDECLIAAGGKQMGKIDFLQMHTYANGGNWNAHAPFKVDASSYNLNKPMVIGEFASVCAQGEGIEQLYDYAYNRNYQGVWAWQYNAGGDCSNDRPTIDRGMQALKGRNGSGGVVNFPVN